MNQTSKSTAEKKQPQSEKNPLTTLIRNIPKGLLYAFIITVLSVLFFSLGHLLMGIGTLIVDRILIGRGIGYPFVTLFKLQPPKHSWKNVSNRVYLTNFSIFLSFSLLLLWWRSIEIINIFLIQMAIINIIKVFLNILRKIKKKDINDNYGCKKINIILNVLGFQVWIMEALLNFMHTTLKMREFDAYFIQRFKEKFETEFKLTINCKSYPLPGQSAGL